MLTQCPNCDTSFRVTSEILRVAQGQVRCGRCETQFDALERLVEEDPAEDSDTDDATIEATDLALSEPDLEQEPGNEAEEWVELDYAELPASAETAVDDDEDDQDGTAEEDANADDATSGTALADIEEETEPEPEYAAEEEEFEANDAPVSIAVPSRARGSYAPPRRERASALPQPVLGKPAPARQFEDTDEFQLTKRPLRVPSEALWKYVAAPLALLFVFQLFNHYRAPLARHPRFGNAVSGFYRLLGVDVIPDWNLRAYETKRSSVVVDLTRPGTLRARVTVRNRAAFAQPYPLLKLVLYDRFGGAVRAREFEPMEYLDKPVLPNARMAPLQEVNASFSIVDPGKEDASGHLFYVCLRGNNGSVCADDLPMISN